MNITISRRNLLCALLFSGAMSHAMALPQTARPHVYEKGSRRYVVDLLGRTTEIPAAPKRIVCTGSGALRIISYVQALDRLVGVEASDKRYEHDPKRDYAYAHHERLKKLPVIGKGGGTAFTANPEAILALEPDIVFTGYSPEAAEQLSRETGLPVVSLYYRSLGLVHESFLQAIELAGDILGLQPRSRAILNYTNAVQADLDRRVAGFDPRSVPSVYPGAVTYSGSHGFAGTYNRFGPLTAIGVRSISDKNGREGYYEADLEFVLQSDPEIIFLDPANLPLVAEEVKTKRGYFESLRAVKNNRVYAMPSYNQYSTNVAYSLANAYYAGTILLPERFADVNFAAKFDEIVSFFNGKGWYADMARYGQGFGLISLL